MSDMVPRLQPHRATLLAAYDATAWIGAYVLFAWLRYDQVSSNVPWPETIALALVTVVIFTMVAWATRLHQGRSALATLDEMVFLGAAVLGIGFLVTLANFVVLWIPRSVPPSATVAMLVVA